MRYGKRFYKKNEKRLTKVPKTVRNGTRKTQGYGTVRFGTVRYGTVRYSTVRYGHGVKFGRLTVLQKKGSCEMSFVLGVKIEYCYSEKRRY